MAVQYSITATFKDHKGKVAHVKLMNPQGIANFMTMGDAATFGRGIAKLSRAGLISVTSSGTEYLGEYPDNFGVLTTAALEHYDRCEQKLMLYFRNRANGRMISIQVPAPADSCFADQNPTNATWESVATTLAKASNMQERDLIPIRGGLKSRLAKMQDQAEQ